MSKGSGGQGAVAAPPAATPEVPSFWDAAHGPSTLVRAVSQNRGSTTPREEPKLTPLEAAQKLLSDKQTAGVDPAATFEAACQKLSLAIHPTIHAALLQASWLF